MLSAKKKTCFHPGIQKKIDKNNLSIFSRVFIVKHKMNYNKTVYRKISSIKLLEFLIRLN